MIGSALHATTQPTERAVVQPRHRQKARKAAEPVAPTMTKSEPRWTVVRLSDRTLGCHAEAWLGLWMALPLRHPMLHPLFVEALLKHWGSGHEYLCILSTADAVHGMAIVQRVRTGCWQLFLPTQSQVGAAVIREIDDARPLLHQLPGHATVLDLLAIDPAVVPSDFAVDRPLEIVPYTHTIAVTLDGSFDAYWQRRPKKLRENIRRNLAEAHEQLGELEWRWIESPQQVDAAVERYAALECRGWKATEGTALAPGNDQHRFYAELMREHGVVAELWGQGELLASRLMWAPPDSPVVALKTTYLETHRSAGLGRLLLRWVLERAHERWPLRRFEFCTDARGDLHAWADDKRHVNHLSLFRNEGSRGLRNAAQAIARTVKPPSAPPVRSGGGNGLGLSVHRSVRHLPAGALGLLEKAEQCSLQLGSTWLAVLEDTVYRDREAPYYFVLTQGAETLVVWPLLGPDRDSGPGLKSMANYYCAITGPAVQPWCKPVQMVSLIQFVVRTLGSAHRLQLFPMDPNDHSTHLTRAALRMAGFGVFGYFGFWNRVYSGVGGWPTYLKCRSGSLRSNIKRAQKKLLDGGGRVEIITNPSEVERGLQAYEAVYARSWKKPEPYPEFFRDLAKRLSERNHLRLGVVWLGDRPIAAAFWTVAHGVAEIHKLAYDEDYKHLSAGTALAAALFEQVLQRDGAEKIDYLIGDDDYKQHWMNQRQQRWGFVAGRVHHPLGACLVLREGLKRLVKESLAWGDLRGGLHEFTPVGEQQISRMLKLAVGLAVTVTVILNLMDR